MGEPQYIKDEDGNYTVVVRGIGNDIHPTARLGRGVIISGWDYIGRNAKIGSRTRLANWVNVDVDVVLGKNCNLQVYTVLSMGTKCGDNCFFAGKTAVADEKFPMAGPQIRKPTIFGDNTIVGMGANVIGGITIGDNAVIGMGANVTKDVPANEVWIGSPAAFKMTRAEYDRKKAEYEGKILGTAI